MKAFIDYFETSVATREDKHSYESNTSSAFYLSIPFHKFLSYEKKKNGETWKIFFRTYQFSRRFLSKGSSSFFSLFRSESFANKIRKRDEIISSQLSPHDNFSNEEITRETDRN